MTEVIVDEGPLTIRILYLEHNTDGTVGGSHVCLLDICRGLDRSRFQPVVWFFQHNALVQDFRDCGAEVLIAPPPAPLQFRPPIRVLAGPFAIAQSMANAARTLLLAPLRWAAAMRRLRVDLVHLNNNFAADPDLSLAALLLRIPCIAHQRGFAPRVDTVARWLARRFARVLAISTSVRADLQAKGVPEERISLVFDGIDPARVVAAENAVGLRDSLGIRSDEVVIGVVGNIKYWKGQITMMRALPEILRRHPATRCLFVGAAADSEYVEQLRGVMIENGLESKVSFLGYRRAPSVFMSIMDVFVHTSVEPEPFGIVNLEAMALSKPVIATAHGGPLDVVVDGVTGLLIPPADATALANAVCALLSDPALRRRMGDAGRQRLLEHFSAARNVAQIQAVYEDVLHGTDH